MTKSNSAKEPFLVYLIQKNFNKKSPEQVGARNKVNM
ncbi:MAG: hypothetical protein RL582_1551 [Bacteroidota bacterium]